MTRFETEIGSLFACDGESFFQNYAPSAAGQNTGIDLSLAVGSPQIGGGQNALGVPLTDTTGAPYKYDVGA